MTTSFFLCEATQTSHFSYPISRTPTISPHHTTTTPYIFYTNNKSSQLVIPCRSILEKTFPTKPFTRSHTATLPSHWFHQTYGFNFLLAAGQHLYTALDTVNIPSSGTTCNSSIHALHPRFVLPASNLVSQFRSHTPGS